MYSSAYAPSHPTGAPFGTMVLDRGQGATEYGFSHSPHAGFEGNSNIHYGGPPSGGPDHRGDTKSGGPNSQSRGSGYEEKGFGHTVAPQVYNNGPGHHSKGNNYGGTLHGPPGPGSATGGYAPGGPRRESVGPGVMHGGSNPNYDMTQPYGSPYRGDDRGKYSGQSSSYNTPQPYGLYADPRRNEAGKDYPGLNPRDTPGLGTTAPVNYGAPPWSGTHYSAEDRDQYTGNKYKN
ncbi:hypothetical protein EDC04DRAFT_2212577 [Pisolithus marmoratus]|nr:hypothetical protein EDC04DRAFT_2212577 [Pisolithus marmoratus]